MSSTIYEYFTLIFILVLIDSMYLYAIKKPFSAMIESIQQSSVQVKMFSVLTCYMLVSTCIFYFIWKKNASYKEAFLLGCLVYGIFDSTNHALFLEWDAQLSLIDTLWGGTLFTSTYFVMKLLYLR